MQLEARDPPPVVWPGRFGKKRLSILRASGAQPHRYRAYRAAAMLSSLSLLALVPLSGLARVDLSTGEHRALFTSTDLIHGLIAIGVAIFVLYFLTFNVNLVAGRMLCGWGCPIGQLNRLTDTIVAQTKRADRWRWGAILGGFALALSLSVVLWWTSFGAISIAASIPLAAAALLFSRAWGWSFCREVCPIGLYYSVVQTQRPLGILHDRTRCLDEGACVRACPVQLDARNLAAQKHGIGGFAFDGLPENNHCLRCGACVEACEIVTSKLEAPALMFGRPSLAREPLVQLPRRTQAAEPIVLLPVEGRKMPRWAQAAIVAVALSGVATYAAIAAQRSSRYLPEETWSQRAQPSSARYLPARTFTKTTLEGDAPPHAIVYLEHPRSGRALGAPRDLEIRIEERTFSEAIYVASTLDRLELVNADPILHTMHATRDRRSALNAALLPRGKPRHIGAPPPGLYRIGCDQHPQEQAELLVLDHPYVTRAGADGKYTLEDVPAGDVTVVVHEAKATHP